MDDDDHHNTTNPITGKFPADSTWSLPGDYTFYGINESRDNNNILSEFGWNLNPPPTESDWIVSSSRSDLSENTNPSTNPVSDHVQVHSQARSVENPRGSSSSSDDRPETSAASGDVGCTGKTPLSDIGGKVKKKGAKKIRQQRFAFMTKTENDHLEDGYRWRKYGQKAVKNSPFPRSYYRCTNSKCTVKKRVERSSTDPTTVITTYEGQHCHHTVGLINHEPAYTRYLAPSSTQPQFHFSRSHLSQILAHQTVSHETRQPQTSFQDQGLLGDIVTPISRN